MHTVDAIILMTFIDHTGRAKAPHVSQLLTHNPGVGVFACFGPRGQAREEAWRNCDRTLRNWWAANRWRVPGEKIAVLEWDALVTCTLPRPEGDLVVKEIKTQASTPDWKWFEENGRMPHWINHRVGVVPFGVSFWSRRALNMLTRPEFNDLFASDVFCELRTGSIISETFGSNPSLRSDYGIKTLDMPNVEWFELPYDGGEGIYHAVKHPIPC